MVAAIVLTQVNSRLRLFSTLCLLCQFCFQVLLSVSQQLYCDRIATLGAMVLFQSWVEMDIFNNFGANLLYLDLLFLILCSVAKV